MHRKLSFPDADINASSVVMVEGDFTTAFQNQAGNYDVVVTYFFIDTARNLMSYFDTIKKVLKPGGYWINLGPLLYGTGPFVQLSLEEIVLVTEAMGFQYLDTDESCGDLTLPDRKSKQTEATALFMHLLDALQVDLAKTTVSINSWCEITTACPYKMRSALGGMAPGAPLRRTRQHLVFRIY
ncbi:hypothetical protein AUP68_08134 [Ilyonectria robusta]